MPWWMRKYLCAPEGDGGAAGGQQQRGNEGQQQQPPPQQTQQQQAQTTQGEQVVNASGRVLPMKQTTIESLKRKERERGKQDAMKEFEDRAKQYGFGTLDDVFKAMADRRDTGNRNGNGNANGNGGGQQQARNGQGDQNGRQAKPKDDRNRNGNGQRNNGQGNGSANGNGQGQPQTQRQDRRDRQREAKLEAERTERLREKRRREESERKLQATEAEFELKFLAKDLGIKDPDYAVSLFVRECQGKSQEDLDKMDERKFFEGLKETRPHLFVDPVVPANTGTTAQGNGNGNAPPPPGAARVNTAGAQAGQFDARKATREEYQAELKKRGLKAPTM